MKHFLFGLLVAALPMLAVQAQVKKGFKYLEKKEYSKAVEAFEVDFQNPKSALEAKYGAAKAYQNMAENEMLFDGLVLAIEVKEAHGQLTPKEKADLVNPYQLTKSNIEQVICGLCGKLSKAIEKSKSEEDFAKLKELLPQPTTCCKTKLKKLTAIFEAPETPVVSAAPTIHYSKKPAQIVDRTATLPLQFVKGINTAGREFLPIVSPDGKYLYFTGVERTDNYANEDIFVSERQPDGSWGTPRLDTVLSASNNEAIVSVSPDGNQIILFREGSPYLANRTETGWSIPKKLPLAHDFGWIGIASISRGGEVLIFEARKTITSQIDIYASKKQPNGTWGNPFSLGSTINTTADERAPFMHTDFKTLYFSSGKPGGNGGLDVYATTRLDSTWQRWSEPQNLGKGINSESDDWGFYIPPSGKIAYLSTSLDRSNDLDIVIAPLPETSRAEEQVVITGKIECKGSIEIEDQTTKEKRTIETLPDGSYTVTLPKSTKVLITPKADCIVTTESKEIDASQYVSEYKEVELPDYVTINDMDKGTSLVMRDILFEHGLSVLNPEAQTEIARLYDILAAYDWTLEIAGHTDNTGNDALNRRLSLERAIAVRTHLISLGYPADKLKVQGFGASAPIADNNTDEGRKVNRRVTLTKIGE